MAKSLDLPSSLRVFRGGWICIKTTREAVAFIDALSKAPVPSLKWLCLRDEFRRAEELGDTNRLHRAYYTFQQQLIGHGWLRDPDALALVTPLELKDGHHKKASLASR